MADRLSRTEVAARAAYVLRANDTGALTVAAPRLYPHMWSWDAAFVAIGLARVSASRALTELETLFAAQWRTGLVPHIVFSPVASRYEPGPDRWASRTTSPHAPDDPATSGLIQPAVHAIAVRRIYDAVRAGAPDRQEIIARIGALWPSLLGWHRYLAEHRDPTGRGLLTIYHGWESGMDNSPRWDIPYAGVVPDPAFQPFDRSDLHALGDPSQRPTDDEYVKYQWLIEELRRARYDDELVRESHSFQVTDVFASAIFATANEELAFVGRELGLGAQDELLAYAERFRRGVLETTDADGFAADVDLRTRRVIRTRTIAGFAPLLCGGLDPHRHRRLVDLLTSPDWCGHPALAYALPPSTSPSSPDFDATRYWRGPQWPPMNLLMIWASGGFGRTGRRRPSEPRDLPPTDRRRLRRVLPAVHRRALGRQTPVLDRRRRPGTRPPMSTRWRELVARMIDHAPRRLAPHRRRPRLPRPSRRFPALAPCPAQHAADGHRATADTWGGRYPEATVFGRLESDGEVRAIFYRTPRGRLTLTPMSAEQAGTLAAHLAGLGHSPSGVVADHDTATAFAAAWQRHTARRRSPSGGRVSTASARSPHRSRARRAGVASRVSRTMSKSCAGAASSAPTSGRRPPSTRSTPAPGPDTRFADRHFTFWETSDGIPVSMAGRPRWSAA